MRQQSHRRFFGKESWARGLSSEEEEDEEEVWSSMGSTAAYSLSLVAYWAFPSLILSSISFYTEPVKCREWQNWWSVFWQAYTPSIGNWNNRNGSKSDIIAIPYKNKKRFSFLVACTRLNTSLCRSVCRSVRQSVGPKTLRIFRRLELKGD